MLCFFDFFYFLLQLGYMLACQATYTTFRLTTLGTPLGPDPAKMMEDVGRPVKSLQASDPALGTPAWNLVQYMEFGQ